jgi:hypothetical protein
MVLQIRALLTAAVIAAASTGTAAAGMAEGPYECWFFSQPQPILNFAVTGPATYPGEADGTTGEYELSGKDISWKSGPMVGAMPDGFTTIYEVRNGNPTVSFVSGRGSEAAFCEKAG